MSRLKFLNPTTPGSRGVVRTDKSFLWKGRPYKSLSKGLNKTGGRNNFGRITCRHIGGGTKKSYRIIDFKRLVEGRYTVVRIEYDPNRTSFIALLQHEEGCFYYVLAMEGFVVGQELFVGNNVDIVNGNVLMLKDIPSGTNISCIEYKHKKGFQLVRSAGSAAQLLGFEKKHALIRLPSGEVRMFEDNCRATIGIVSNSDNKNIKLGKAGASRLRGTRPSVRGVVMNPVDHPHGGGEGRTSGGRHPVTPWGVSTKGKRTRKFKISVEKNIVRRRNKR